MNRPQGELLRQPFHPSCEPLVVVPYRSHQAARSFLAFVLQDSRGLGILYGPPSSGKKTVIRQFRRGLPARLAVAQIDGDRLKPVEFLHAILKSFGRDVESDSYDESLKFLVTFLLQQARHVGAPLILIGNLNKMFPATLQVLCKLAAIRLHGKFALRLIMHSQTAPYAIIHAPAMQTVAMRLISAFELGPLARDEAPDYLYEKLRAAGCKQPEALLPAKICSRLYELSNGWPGILDELAKHALNRPRRGQFAESAAELAALPVLTPVLDYRPEEEKDVQKMLVTLRGRTLFDFDLEGSKILIGRSRLCDVVIDSRFVSKFHAIILRSDDSMHLADLNSSNGTYLNSRRIQVKALRHDDIISLGNHGIKLVIPGIRTRAESIDRDLADTATMRTLSDARREKLSADQAHATEKGSKI